MSSNTRIWPAICPHCQASLFDGAPELPSYVNILLCGTCRKAVYPEKPKTVPEIILPLTWERICADYLAGLTELPETAEIPAAVTPLESRWMEFIEGAPVADMIEETYLRR